MSISCKHYITKESDDYAWCDLAEEGLVMECCGDKCPFREE